MNSTSLRGAIRTFTTLAVASVLLGAPVSAATIVTNGSFESGVPGNTPGLNNGALFGNLNSSGPSWDRWRNIDGWRTVSG